MDHEYLYYAALAVADHADEAKNKEVAGFYRKAAQMHKLYAEDQKRNNGVRMQRG